MIADLNTFLNKAVPDTRLTIKKYLDAKFEYLVSSTTCKMIIVSPCLDHAGLDIGYVPAGPDAFFRWSGQFGPQQLIFYWPAGPVDFFFFFFFFRITIHI